MDFDLSEDQALLKAAAERFVTDAYPDLAPRRAARATPTGFSTTNWRRLAESGLLALPVSASNGGMAGPDGGRAELAIAMEAFGRGLVAEPFLDVAVVAAGLLDIALKSADAASNAARQSAVLHKIISGEQIVSLAHAERAARFDRQHVGTTARPHGDGFVLDGAKTAVLAGGAADQFIVSARITGNAADAGDIGFWLVGADAAGVDRRSYRLADGGVAAELVLRGVAVAPGDRLAGDSALLTPVVARARLAASAEMLGLMGLLFDTTLAYVKTRHQFGQPLGAFQVIQHRLTEAYVRVEQARSQVTRAALADSASFARAAAGAHAYVAEAAIAVGHEAVQLHGGMGITDELVIGHALKRVRVLALTFGDATAALDDFRRAA